jgi:hypothetical protein
VIFLFVFFLQQGHKTLKFTVITFIQTICRLCVLNTIISFDGKHNIYTILMHFNKKFFTILQLIFVLGIRITTNSNTRSGNDEKHPKTEMISFRNCQGLHNCCCLITTKVVIVFEIDKKMKIVIRLRSDSFAS